MRLGLRSFALFLILLLGLSACPAQTSDKSSKASEQIQSKALKDLNLYGQDLLEKTPVYLGPQAKNPALRLAGNRLSCISCHLNGGKDSKAMGFMGISQRYPRYRALENRKITLRERINSCFERSLNAKPLADESRELKALESYIRQISQSTAPTETLAELQLPPLKLLTRAAHPKAGEKLYQYHCSACHGKSGEGQLKNNATPDQGYVFPPLWGQDSYGQGSNLNRLTLAARYIKANMPLGRPLLSAEEAYDIAAFINSHERPQLKQAEKDFPDRSKKPADVPYPPFADQQSSERHRFGPFTDLKAPL
ncbi:cytochrome C oxidase Cbb3 [bacterium (Candidatus Blackallbacteria) CG17_big_fil_post_rev_8_21_14_2_50_48_46]|uniref:Cytochrome C oxidase Cbb3 n=1 Tax=bacterium (Candidatus Blackallbacteria) CG17_big_fil_post_rev_8_21_14_2_50_48_46 TaxID=2014261 RepID=A0A2M7G2N6_9BACT|nr:MAG: cytochrome C oxidase Cbb3 [bacterium (Candidatus Blackallbacteria) CG18_big_fil_WC_8_21_14_2_50_49_26]PIW16041.1 MAG: cytochrome C oxidase Cbb3 [bacterium (Candidatus Blackallbacteria) CG17_big_fil_post_rev_8_21_14_2_50_48_46]PIW50453.1 MAG: cytochrome C oxidase Cbb3 [bacterium (Candidatus Blackallbacteria) CG13_big_fil_rev_8_21_14_2_50_49_14]